jgi:hypothetical protein
MFTPSIFFAMKHLFVILFVLFAVLGLCAFAPDGFLLPESFYLHKGDKLNVHLLTGDNLMQEGEERFNAKKTSKFNIYEGSKLTDLLKVAKDSAAPVLSYTNQQRRAGNGGAEYQRRYHRTTARRFCGLPYQAGLR